tara:strand:- start:284 stop:499 length:216 start_codon:yes stop_codon:yes gene_type:complete
VLLANANHLTGVLHASKKLGKTLVSLYQKKFDINIKSIKLYFAYGPRNKKDNKKYYTGLVDKPLNKIINKA